MQVQTIQGFFSKGIFYHQGKPVPIPENQMVIINVLGVTINEQEKIEADVNFWNNIDKQIEDAMDEEMQLDDFPRLNFKRDLIIFNEEE